MVKANYGHKADNTRALISAQKELTELRDFIKTLPDGMDVRRSDQTERKGLNKVIKTFHDDISKKYWIRATEFANDISPLERSEKFNQVLGNMREHALLLADIVRFHPRSIFTAKRSNFLKNAITLISRRLVGDEESEPLPVLLPLFTLSFKYIHFKYMKGFGLIGIPPEIALSKSNNQRLSALWHEIVGHRIATVRASGNDPFINWASDLATQLKREGYWDEYRILLIQSVLPDLPQNKEIEPLDILSKSETDSKEHDAITILLDDPEWQNLWLSEFLEDIFWIMVLKDDKTAEYAPLQATANALILKYSDPGIGDPQHPPMLLRLLVGAAYLNPENPEGISRVIQPFYISKNKTLSQESIQILGNMAKLIADFCRNHIINSKQPILYKAEIEPDEIELARLVLDPKSTSRMLENVVKSDNVMNCSAKPDINGLEKEIKKAQNIDELIAIKFVDIDPQGDSPVPAHDGHDHTHNDGSEHAKNHDPEHFHIHVGNHNHNHRH